MALQLQKINIKNYKCFENHSILFNNNTIIIGQNNAGKSTLVEVLRIISTTINMLQSVAIYKHAPIWSNLGISIKGISPSLKSLDVDLDIVFHRYSDPPAIIEAFFENNLKINVIIQDKEEVFASAYIGKTNILSRNDFETLDMPNVFVLPQIVPLLKNEKVIREETIMRNLYNRKISRNFRTHLYNNKDTEEFKKFEKLIEQTWNKIQIRDLYIEDSDVLLAFLNLRDGDFTAEIYNMGHGVQMWLQTMWFISWVGDDSIIVLDEPDVYMHPDLQRKLIRLLRNFSNQIIIATHSIEIVSEVEPSNIVIINREKEESCFADSIPVVQLALNNIGSVHNLSISRLLACKKILYVEGKDVQILKRLYNTLFPTAKYPFDNIPSSSTGGWGGWEIQKHNANKIRNELQGSIIYFIFDRDFHTDNEIKERYIEAKALGLNLEIWSKKEIENYLINAKAVARIIFKNIKTSNINELENEITLEIDRICDELKEETYDNFLDEYKNRNKKLSIKTCKDNIFPALNEKWKEDKSTLISGKVLISKISMYCQSIYKTQISANSLAAELKPKEIPTEMVQFLSKFVD